MKLLVLAVRANTSPIPLASEGCDLPRSGWAWQFGGDIARLLQL